jgi:hypothetical protein
MRTGQATGNRWLLEQKRMKARHPVAPGGTRHLYQPSPEEEGKEAMDIDRRSKSPSSALNLKALKAR